MEELKVLSHRVKMIRIAKGVSQIDMAEAIGLSQTNLSNMESGRTAITIQNLFKIKKILGCKMSDFFVDFDDETFNHLDVKKSEATKHTIELEDAVNILKLLKAVDIKGM